jgi:hypothetical protein
LNVTGKADNFIRRNTVKTSMHFSKKRNVGKFLFKMRVTERIIYYIQVTMRTLIFWVQNRPKKYFKRR